MIWNSWKEKISNKFLEVRGNTKQLYNLVSKLTSTQQLNPLPEETLSNELADRFADYFIEKIRNIQDSLANYATYCPTSMTTASYLVEFKPYTKEEIAEIINSMPVKTCKSDVIPTWVLKGVLPLIITPITTLINLSLEESVFAESWKMAIICPFIKKLGLELVYSNYRPVSNLPVLSKVVKKCMLKQFNTHCDNNKLLPDYQSLTDQITAQKHL